TLSRIHNSPNDLKSLRSRAYVLARRIAQRHGIADCVVSSPKVGLGFVVDTPAHPIIPMDGPHFEATWMRQWLWWHLLLTSEYTALPERMFAFKTRLTEFFVTRRAEEYYKWVGEPNWRAQSFELFANPLLSDKDFEDWVFLMETCRRMRTAYTGTDLWGDLK
ncbi:MAG: hypothetical protein OEW08_15450, partial [Gammaproteobacteria bacterium]|nr:hypothetical protein [Gammaproteobacteria bacterium]